MVDVPISWARPCLNFETDGHGLSAKGFHRGRTVTAGLHLKAPAMMIGITILAVLTLVATSEVWKSSRNLERKIENL
jgi:hypothetical protein